MTINRGMKKYKVVSNTVISGGICLTYLTRKIENESTIRF